MNHSELIKKVNISMSKQIDERGYAAAVDVLMDIGVLSRQNYEDWRFGRVPYLERVCTVDLSKLAAVNRQMKEFANGAGLKPSFCYYKQWGRKKRSVIPLRFSKRGDPNIERAYATHYVSAYKIAKLKAEHTQNEDQDDSTEPS